MWITRPCQLLFALLGLMARALPAQADDQVYLGAERIMGVFAERQTTEVEEGGVTQKTSLRSTRVGVLGLTGPTGSSVPRLAFDYFVTDALSVGGSFVYTSYGQSSVFSAEGNAAEQDDELGGGSLWLLAPRAGYRLPFSDTLGVWPHAGFLIAGQKQESVLDQEMNTRRVQSRTTLSLSLDAMFYARPLEHLVLLGGPFIDLGGLAGSYSDEIDGMSGVEGDESLTAFGISFGIGVVF